MKIIKNENSENENSGKLKRKNKKNLKSYRIN